MDEKQLQGHLQEEYKILMSSFDDWDRRCLTIKGLVTAGAAAAVAVVAKEPIHIALPALAFVMALVFSVWILDAQWKSHQHCLLTRIIEIEEYFKINKIGSICAFQIHRSWSETYNKPIIEKANSTKWQRVFHEMPRSFVSNPYATLIIGIISVLILSYFGALGPSPNKESPPLEWPSATCNAGHQVRDVMPGNTEPQGP